MDYQFLDFQLIGFEFLNFQFLIDFFQNNFSYILLLIKQIVLILCVLLILGIAYFLHKLEYFPKKIKLWQLFLQGQKVSPRKIKKQWEQIKNLLKENYDSSWKLAIIKADNLFDSVLKDIGYSGKTCEQRLSSLHPGHLSSRDKILEVHQKKQELVDNPTRQLIQKEAEEIVLVYEEALKEFDLI